MAALLVPDSGWRVFGPAWTVTALSQPLNALSFVTDGIHWGSRDYAYLRNAMLAATGVGATAVLLLPDAPDALFLIWAISAVWIGVRAFFGVARVWPGIGRAPLRA